MSRKRAKAREQRKATKSSTPSLSSVPAGVPEVPEVTDVDAIEIDLDFDDDVDSDPKLNRRAPRVAVQTKVEISGLFGNDPRTDTISDASVHGVFVETAHPYDVGDPVVLHLPLDGGKKLRVSGRVRWVTPFGGLRDAKPGMGIELVGVVGDVREAWSALLKRSAR